MVKRSDPAPADPFDHPSTLRLVREALAEDVGRGDFTSQATIAADEPGEARLVAREGCVAAGLPLVGVVYEALAPQGGVRVRNLAREGARVAAGRSLAKIQGPLRTILTGERLILNLLQQLCGTATLTRAFVEAVAGTGAEILDTRKTIPGMRLLQKYAVRVGGGRNHRFGLDDGILIKDNHVAVCGSVSKAVERARASAPHGLKVEVECDHLAQVEEAIEAGADVVLLDNMTPSEVARAHRRIAGRAVVEVSGGIRLDTVRKYAEKAPVLISVGALTHSASAVDLSLEVQGRRAGRRR